MALKENAQSIGDMQMAVYGDLKKTDPAVSWPISEFSVVGCRSFAQKYGQL